MISINESKLENPYCIVGPRPFASRIFKKLILLPSNIKYKKERTAFLEACKMGNLKKLEYLLDRVGNLNWKTDETCSPLHGAIRHNHVKIVEFLLKNGASVWYNSGDLSWLTFPGPQVLESYAELQEENVEILKLLLEYGLKKDINYKYRKNYHGDTLLHLAVKAKDKKTPEIIDILMSYGANPWIENDKIETPYSLANEEIRQLLIDLDSQNKLQKNLPISTKMSSKNRL